MFGLPWRRRSKEWQRVVESFTSLHSQIEAALSSNIISIGGRAAHGGYESITGANRKQLIEQSRYYFSTSALGFLPISLTTWFALGMGGMSIDRVEAPVKHSERDGDLSPEQERLMTEQSDMLHEFWEKRITEHIFSSYTAQEQIANKLQVDGDLFLLISANAKTLPDDFGIRLIDTTDIEDIICDPEDNAIELYYRRRYAKPQYQFDGLGQGTEMPQAGIHASTEYEEWVDNNHNRKSDYAHRVTLDGAVYHVTFGTDPLLHWGTPALVRAMDWIEGHIEIAGDMRTLIRALCTFVRDIKATPGTKSQLRSLQGMTDNLVSMLASSGGLKQRPPVGADIIHGENVTVQPYDVKTGAADITSRGLRDMVLMVAASTGIPEHMFGNPSTSNLATARSLELPVLKKVRAFQAIMKGVYEDVLNYILYLRYGEAAGRAVIKLPPVLERNVGEYITAITGSYMSGLLEDEDAQQMTKDVLETRI